jgi:hypothetical protein
MTRFLLVAGATCALCTNLPAQQRALTAAPSTRATVSVTLSGPQGSQAAPATITVDYGQPHLRGRTLHTGDLVPLDSVWRFGANESTTLDTGVDLELGGHRLAKGKYSLYVLPSAAGWQLIVNANTGQWGTSYVPDRDVVRIPLKKTTLASPIESLSVWLIPSRDPGPASGEFRFAWGTEQLSTTWRVP